MSEKEAKKIKISTNSELENLTLENLNIVFHDDILFIIFSFLPIKEVFQNCQFVCKQWCNAIQEKMAENFWKTVFFTQFRFSANQKEQNEYEEKVKSQFKEDFSWKFLCSKQLREIFASRKLLKTLQTNESTSWNSNIRVVECSKSEKIVTNEAFENEIGTYAESEKIRSCNVKWKMYTPTCESLGFRIVEKCRIDNEENPSIFIGFLCVYRINEDNEDKIFQINYEDGVVKMKTEIFSEIIKKVEVREAREDNKNENEANVEYDGEKYINFLKKIFDAVLPFKNVRLYYSTLEKIDFESGFEKVSKDEIIRDVEIDLEDVSDLFIGGEGGDVEIEDLEDEDIESEGGDTAEIEPMVIDEDFQQTIEIEDDDDDDDDGGFIDDEVAIVPGDNDDVNIVENENVVIVVESDEDEDEMGDFLDNS